MKIAGVDVDRLIAFLSKSYLRSHKSTLPTLQYLLFLMQPGGRKKRYWCRPSTRSIADTLLISQRTVFRHISILESKGLICRRQRLQKGYKISNIYTPGPTLIKIISLLQEAKDGRAR